MNAFSADVNAKVYKLVIDKSLTSIINNKIIINKLQIGIYLVISIFTIAFTYIIFFFNKIQKTILNLLNSLNQA
jgi:hypothetical protein